VSKDFDTTLSDVIDLAAAAAHTAGAPAARLRGRKRTMRKRIAISTTALVLVAAGATAAFKAASPGDGTPQKVAASPSRTATATPTAPQSAIATPTPGATTQVPVGETTCGNGGLLVTQGRGAAASGTDLLFLVFTNESGRTCTVQGFPTVVVANGSGVLVTAMPVLTGDVDGEAVAPTSAPLVTLAPKASATAVLTAEGSYGETCYPSGVGTLQVTAPGTTRATSIGGPYTIGDGGACAALEISQLVSNANGEASAS
jgi:hypothetical protein